MPVILSKRVIATESKKPGLTKPQLRVLKVLSKLEAGANVDAHTLAAKAKVADTWITGFAFKACAANTTPALCEQGLAKAKEIDVEGQSERRYSITAAGRKALEKANAK